MKLFKQLIPVIFLLIAACSNNSNPVDTRSPAQLTGIITDYFEVPVAGVKVTTDPVSETAMTDKAGKFVIKNISTGSFKVYAEKNGYRTEMVTASIKEKQTTDVQVTLRLLVSISGKIIDNATENGLANVLINIEKYPIQISTSSDGSFQIKDIAIGFNNTSFTKTGYCFQKINLLVDLNKPDGYDFRLNKLTPIEMVTVAGGSFQMGDSLVDGFINERPIHSVTLSSFAISKFEVTQHSWVQTFGTNPAKFWGDNNPVESISWSDAINYCNTRSTLEGFTQCYKTVNGIVTCDFNADGYRLPTEAEWEYAARGGNLSKNTKYSGSSDLKEVAWFYTYSENITHTVGTKKSNELGVYDMSGNVWEFCWDYFDANYYSQSAIQNPKGPAQGQSRVMRGGSWTDDTIFNRVFYRNYYNQNSKGTNVGFRIVRNSK